MLPMLVVRLWGRDAFQVDDAIATGFVEQPAFGSCFHFLFLFSEVRLHAPLVLRWWYPQCFAAPSKRFKTCRPLHGVG
jgi:hypothetical protein